MLWLAGDAMAFASEAQFVAELLDFPPSLVAAAVLYVARREIGNVPLWPRSLAELTGHQVRLLYTDVFLTSNFSRYAAGTW